MKLKKNKNIRNLSKMRKPRNFKKAFAIFFLLILLLVFAKLAKDTLSYDFLGAKQEQYSYLRQRANFFMTYLVSISKKLKPLGKSYCLNKLHFKQKYFNAKMTFEYFTNNTFCNNIIASSKDDFCLVNIYVNSKNKNIKINLFRKIIIKTN